MDFLSDRDRLEAGECRDVLAWRLGMDFAVAIYRLTDGWPRVDPLELTADLRRNATNLPAIVARGFGTGDREILLQCLEIVRDTGRQVDAQLGLAARVGYCTPATVAEFRRAAMEIVHEVEVLEERYRIL